MSKERPRLFVSESQFYFSNLFAAALAAGFARSLTAPVDAFHEQRVNYLRQHSVDQVRSNLFWRTVMKDNGPVFMVQGLGKRLAQHVPHTALNFTFFEFLKFKGDLNALPTTLVAGAISGAAAHETMNVYNKFVSKNSGVQLLNPMSLARESLFSGLYFSLYGSAKRLFGLNEHQSSWCSLGLTALLTTSIATAAVHPFDRADATLKVHRLLGHNFIQDYYQAIASSFLKSGHYIPLSTRCVPGAIILVLFDKMQSSIQNKPIF